MSKPWTREELRDRAEWLVRDVPEVGDRFSAIADEEGHLGWLRPYDHEDYDAFAERSLDVCEESGGDGIIIAWQWPGLPYVSVLLACPAEGATSVAVFPNQQELNTNYRNKRMIKALEEHPGFVRICDSSNENHLVAVSVLKSVAKAGPKTSYLTYRGGKTPIFISAPVETVKTEIKRAKTMKRQWRQLQFDFDEKREASAGTPTSQTTPSPEESEAVSGGS